MGPSESAVDKSCRPGCLALRSIAVKDNPTRARFQGHVSYPAGNQVPGPRTLTFPLKEEDMTNKLYVGGLSYGTTDKQLEDLFAAHGTVESARVITDKFTGRSKGFGFVEMSSGAEAQSAIQALNGTEFDGRNITVNEARPQERRSGFG